MGLPKDRTRESQRMRFIKTLTHSARFLLLLGCLLLVSACGYQFVGRSSPLPPEIRRIAVPTFENNTFEPLLDERLTEAVKKAFIAYPRLQVVNSASDADAVLKGRIITFLLTPISFNPLNEAAEYRVRIQTDLTLQDSRNQKILWQEKMMETTADYFVFQDPVDPARVDIARTRDAEDRAIAEAAKVLGENLVSQLLEGFPSH
jgi:outer membrane lipopolysaccharide assembly protein LptE/RlpB